MATLRSGHYRSQKATYVQDRFGDGRKKKDIFRKAWSIGCAEWRMKIPLSNLCDHCELIECRRPVKAHPSLKLLQANLKRICVIQLRRLWRRCQDPLRCWPDQYGGKTASESVSILGKEANPHNFLQRDRFCGGQLQSTNEAMDIGLLL